MFSKAIVKSEEFLVMPKSSQALYFHLGMEADDDGFIHPGQIMRSGGFQGDDLKILLAKRFLLTFESGVVVIKHWLIHNLIQKDRHTETRYEDELKSLFIKENKAYTDRVPVSSQSGNTLLPQVRLGKDRLEIAAPAAFSFSEEREKWKKDEKPHIRVIAWFFEVKDIWHTFESAKQVSSASRRHMKDAKEVVAGEWKPKDLRKAMDRVQTENPDLWKSNGWTLGTLLKYLAK